MACYQPIRAFQREPGGRVQILPARGPRGEPSNLELPCGKCLGCQQMRATHWAERCKHEASQHAHNSFLTLTYNDRFRPHHVEPRHLQLFLKRLRKRIPRILARQTTPQRTRDEQRLILSDPRSPLRYLACGEYGETTGLPHYHVLLINADFPGPRIGNTHGHELRTNDLLAACWAHPKSKESYGFHSIGTAEPGAVAGYIAQYVLKSHRFNIHHNPLCDRDGVYNENWIRPPFIRVSKGMGSGWLRAYHTDLARGYLVSNGRQQAIPRYYKRALTKHFTWKEYGPLTPSEHAKQQQQEAWNKTAITLEYYQHEWKTLNKESDKNTEARRTDAQRIHEQKYNNKQRR